MTAPNHSQRHFLQIVSEARMKGESVNYRTHIRSMNVLRLIQIKKTYSYYEDNNRNTGL